MDESNAGLVDIVREYLDVNERMRDLFVHFRAGTLGFGPVRDLFADDERSPLFRLKERCHRLFRRRGSNREPMWRAELFDLAVGSLFHEAMKFRENFYQQVVYAPRVESRAPEVAAVLGGDARSEEALQGQLEAAAAAEVAISPLRLDEAEEHLCAAEVGEEGARLRRLRRHEAGALRPDVRVDLGMVKLVHVGLVREADEGAPPPVTARHFPVGALGRFGIAGDGAHCLVNLPLGHVPAACERTEL